MTYCVVGSATPAYEYDDLNPSRGLAGRVKFKGHPSK